MIRPSKQSENLMQRLGDLWGANRVAFITGEYGNYYSDVRIYATEEDRRSGRNALAGARTLPELRVLVGHIEAERQRIWHRICMVRK